jgi:hypothetical protein
MRWTLLPLTLLLIAGCDENMTFRTPTHAERLPSGATVKVTSFNLVWGNEGDHPDEHTQSGDCLAMEYVMAEPNADVSKREAEALQAFELVRATSELWGFKTAELSAFPKIERKGHYDFYAFERAADGKWSFKREDRKVFATD